VGRPARRPFLFLSGTVWLQCSHHFRRLPGCHDPHYGNDNVIGLPAILIEVSKLLEPIIGRFFLHCGMNSDYLQQLRNIFVLFNAENHKGRSDSGTGTIVPGGQKCRNLSIRFAAPTIRTPIRPFPPFSPDGW